MPIPDSKAMRLSLDPACTGIDGRDAARAGTGAFVVGGLITKLLDGRIVPNGFGMSTSSGIFQTHITLHAVYSDIKTIFFSRINKTKK